MDQFCIICGEGADKEVLCQVGKMKNRENQKDNPKLDEEEIKWNSEKVKILGYWEMEESVILSAEELSTVIQKCIYNLKLGISKNQ